MGSPLSANLVIHSRNSKWGPGSGLVGLAQRCKVWRSEPQQPREHQTPDMQWEAEMGSKEQAAYLG